MTARVLRASLLSLLLFASLVLTGCELIPIIVPPAKPASTPVPSPTATAPPTPILPTPSPGPTATRTPVPSPTPVDLFEVLGIPRLAEILARSDNLTEYTFDYKVMSQANGPAIVSGKAYVKGPKLRQELFIQGQRAVIIGDSRKMLYQLLFSDQKTAYRLDFSQIGNQAVNPNEAVDALPATTELVGAEIMHGESSAVFLATTEKLRLKFWVWIERGLPLRVEVASEGALAILDFSNYRFGTQPDLLFELPAGTKVIDVPTSQPNLPRTGPSLPTPSRLY